MGSSTRSDSRPVPSVAPRLPPSPAVRALRACERTLRAPPLRCHAPGQQEGVSASLTAPNHNHSRAATAALPAHSSTYPLPRGVRAPGTSGCVIIAAFAV
jgi:hypothetical protein